MNNNEECKIIDDLLPMYVDNLTNDVTNKFIENHLSKCPECKQKLADMQNDLDVELNDIDLNVEIDGLKKIKNRNRLLIVSSVIGAIVLFSLCLWFNNNYKFYMNDNGKIALYELNPAKKYSDCSYIIIKGKKYVDNNSINQYVDITSIIAVNSLDECISVRQIVDGYTEETLNEIYTNYTVQNIDSWSNVKIEDGILYYNINNYIDKNKNFAISKISNYYNEIEYIKEL